MAMRDWIAKLDDFLKLGDRQLLTHAGAISHEAALAKAQAEAEEGREMIAGLKPYPEYKDSDVPWLGRIPPTRPGSNTIKRCGELWSHC